MDTELLQCILQVKVGYNTCMICIKLIENCSHSLLPNTPHIHCPCQEVRIIHHSVSLVIHFLDNLMYLFACQIYFRFVKYLVQFPLINLSSAIFIQPVKQVIFFAHFY